MRSVPGAQGHSTDPIRVAESPWDAGELVCFLTVASPWSADFIQILQLEPCPSLLLPPGCHRTALGSGYKVPAHSAEQGQAIICDLLAVGAFIVAYVCTLPLLAAPNLPVPPPAPAASHEGSGCPSSETQEIERPTEGRRARVLYARKGHETLRMSKVLKSSFKQYSIGIGCLKSLEKHWKKLFLHLSHNNFRWETQS